jgi:hypothetical protein
MPRAEYLLVQPLLAVNAAHDIDSAGAIIGTTMAQHVKDEGGVLSSLSNGLADSRAHRLGMEPCVVQPGALVRGRQATQTGHSPVRDKPRDLHTRWNRHQRS